RVLEHPADTRRVGPELRAHPGGEHRLDPREGLEDAAARPVEIGAVLEDHVHVAEAEVGEAADRPHVGRTEGGAPDRIGDLVLHDVGAAVPAGVDDDLRVREVGDRVHRDVLDDIDPVGDHEGGREEDHEPVLGAPPDDRRDDATPRAHQCTWREGALGGGDGPGRGGDATGAPDGAGVGENDCSAAFRLDSESMRKFAEVTTRSPSWRPESTWYPPHPRAPSTISRGSSRPSPWSRKTSRRSPGFKMALSGTKSAAPRSVRSSTSAYISGFRRSPSFATSMRTLIVRVAGSTVGLMEVTEPRMARPGW